MLTAPHRIDGSKFYLRRHIAADGPLLGAFLADPENTRFMTFPDATKHFAAGADIIAQTITAYERPSATLALAICDGKSDTCIGSCGASERGDAIEIFYLVFAGARRRGAASEAAMLLIGELQRQHSTATLIAFIDPFNLASIAILGRLGFKDEGPMSVSGKSGRRYILSSK